MVLGISALTEYHHEAERLVSSRFHRKVIVKLVPENGPRVANGAVSYFEER